MFQEREDKPQKLKQKVKTRDNELVGLERVRRDHEDAMNRYEG